MAGVDVYFQALDECADTAGKVGKRLVPADLLPKDAPPPKSFDSFVFGRLGNSKALSEQVENIWKETITTDLQQGGKKLEAVERALDQVQKNIRTADKP